MVIDVVEAERSFQLLSIYIPIVVYQYTQNYLYDLYT